MRVDEALKFQDAEIHEAALYVLDKLVGARYPIGAWPQRFRKPEDANRASHQEEQAIRIPGQNNRPVRNTEAITPSMTTPLPM
ncbi:MAG TPA: hypothetical protein VEX68_22305 [Bryobacteraceae bacterium]|nr:hypothetical protein [Bryobacteraceae bacterium]